MPDGYGRIRGTTDTHGEDLDVHVNSKDFVVDGPVFIIDQVSLSGMFDEHKVMVGYPTAAAAVALYESVIKPGIAPAKIGAVTIMNQEEFVTWCMRADKTKSPASFDSELGSIALKKCQIYTKDSSRPTVLPTTATSVLDGVEITLGNLTPGPKLITKADTTKGYHHTCHIYGKIEYKTWWKFLDQVVRLLETATEDDRFTFLISTGGGSVPTVGPLLSGMLQTKAFTHTVANGPVASAGVFVWAFGKRREIRPHAYFMEHTTFQVIMGKTQYINAQTAFTDRYARMMIKRLLDLGMFTPEETESMYDHSADTYVTGAEMISRVGEFSGEEDPAHA